MPCPHGVDIINCFTEYNIAHMMDNPKASAMQYFSLIDEDARADWCVDCGECIPFCTQMINIPEELEKVYEYFGDEFDHFWFDFEKQNQIFSLFLNEIEQPNINYTTY